jgi:hypothetical protein
LAARQLFDAPQHLARRAVRERGEEDARGRDALLDEVGDAIRDGARLARTRARDDERRARRGGRHGELLLVQFLAVTRQPFGQQPRPPVV